MEHNPFLSSIELLNQSGIRYVLVGGFAVVMHGFNRFTPDINVVVELESERLRPLLESLKQADLMHSSGDDIAQFADASYRENLIDGGKRWLYSLRDVQAPTFSLDFFLQYSCPFEELYTSSEEREAQGHKFVIASKQHLIDMKRAAGRGQDRVDIEIIEYIERHQAELQDPSQLDSLLAGVEDMSQQEQIKGLAEFSQMNDTEKVDWLLHMLTHLGKFCVL